MFRTMCTYVIITLNNIRELLRLVLEIVVYDLKLKFLPVSCNEVLLHVFSTVFLAVTRFSNCPRGQDVIR